MTSSMKWFFGGAVLALVACYIPNHAELPIAILVFAAVAATGSFISHD